MGCVSTTDKTKRVNNQQKQRISQHKDANKTKPNEKDPKKNDTIIFTIAIQNSIHSLDTPTICIALPYITLHYITIHYKHTTQMPYTTDT